MSEHTMSEIPATPMDAVTNYQSRQRYLIKQGFIIGTRDPNLNQDSPGKFMANQ